jgi:hypothetical protein
MVSAQRPQIVQLEFLPSSRTERITSPMVGMGGRPSRPVLIY